MKIKTDTYYDVTCYACARSISTDYEMGMMPTQECARTAAQAIGFINVDGRNFCPDCVNRLNIKVSNKRR